MFKTAAAKIAHNSTLPALGGNQDLRPLQDLITAEKAVLIGLQKLSVDYSKASEALRTWGLNEGDDLGDILSASTTLLNHFSSALSQYATHGHAIRDQLKAIRTREEDLEELKRRRRTVLRKAEDADKKLSKMSPEHKNLTMQTDTLNRLRDEIRTMDSDIMTEEAALGDFKRSATRAWMGLKFGGLLECCEKGSIAAEFGKMIISEISEEMTQPGLPRSLYYGQPKTENLVAEASRCINEVVLSTVPSIGSRDRRQYNQELVVPQNAFSSNQGYPSSPVNENKPQPPPPMLDDVGDNSQRPFGESIGSPSGLYGPSSANQPYSSTDQQPYSASAFGSRLPPQIQEDGTQKVVQTMDDFGMNSRSPGLIDSSNTSGGRFATFPVKTRAPGSGGGYSLQDPSSAPRQQDQSFSASVAEALEDRTSLETGQATEGTHTHPQQNSYAGRNPGDQQVPWTGPVQNSYQFSSSAPNNSLPPIPGATSSPSALPPPPPGAAPPNPWGGLNREDPMQGPAHSKVNASLSEDALLAYMTSAQDDLHTDDEPSSPTASTLAAPSQSEEEQQRISRHVRFGEVEDVHEQMEKKRSLEKERQEQQMQQQVRNTVSGDGKLSEDVLPQSNTNGGGAKEGTRSNSSSPNNKPSSHRVPPPTIFTDIDEQALDAAAARDVARELDALNVNQHQPGSPDSGKQNQQYPQENESPVTPSRGRSPSNPILSQSDIQQGVAGERDHSPLSPPHAPFASTRSVSPHRYAELNMNAPPPAPYGGAGGYTPAQPYPDSGSSSGSYGSPQNISASLGAYTQPYAPATIAPDAHIGSSSPSSTSSLPPRFLALNRSSENQVPPRFQNQIPPRFQAGGPTQVSSTGMSMGMGMSSSSSLSSPSEQTQADRYPRPLGATSPYTRSNGSLNASAATASGAGAGAGSGGPRTISAAAFKRPRNMSSDTHGLGDQFTKKSLPSSPYPMREQGERNVSGLSSNSSPAAATITASAPVPTMSTSGGPPTLPPIESTSASQTELDDEYDYISAYVNSSNPNSPVQRDFGNVNPGTVLPSSSSSLAYPGAMAARSQAQSQAGGYGEGRFATDLEGGNDGLR